MRFNLQMFSTAMKLLPLLCLCLLTRSGTTFANEDGPVIFMKEGSDVILPCSLSSKENIEFKRFEWKKGDQQVFVFESGAHSNNSISGQAQQFKGRVSHFQDELKYGNASITIRNTTVTDSGDYTCDFPRLQPRQKFNIQLVVVGPGAIRVEEGSDVILPCSLSGKKDITLQVFDWKKDGQKEVLLYEGTHGVRFSGQDQQFQGRVSHFQQELKSGNASIIIRHTKVADSGVYTCTFPRLQTFHIQLVVDRILKDRSGENIPGASPEPSVNIIQTKDGMVLQCVVVGANIKPKVEWQDIAGNILPAVKLHDLKSGDHFSITLQTTVTKTGNYRCVATQEEISHQIYTDRKVEVNGSPSGSHTGWIVAAVLAVVLVL